MNTLSKDFKKDIIKKIYNLKDKQESLCIAENLETKSDIGYYEDYVNTISNRFSEYLADNLDSYTDYLAENLSTSISKYTRPGVYTQEVDSSSVYMPRTFETIRAPESSGTSGSPGNTGSPGTSGSPGSSWLSDYASHHHTTSPYISTGSIYASHHHTTSPYISTGSTTTQTIIPYDYPNQKKKEKKKKRNLLQKLTSWKDGI
jgi:hypothetical protein